MMEMSKFNFKPIVDFAIGVAKLIACGTALSLPYILANDREEDVGYRGTYDEAIRVITNSDMFSSHKQEAIMVLKRSEDIYYYRAIIAIVESDMFSSGKLSSIREISTK